VINLIDLFVKEGLWGEFSFPDSDNALIAIGRVALIVGLNKVSEIKETDKINL